MLSLPKKKGSTPFEAAFRAPAPTHKKENPQEISQFRRTLSAAFRTTEDLNNAGSNSVWEHSDDDCSTRGIRSGVQSTKTMVPIGVMRRTFIVIGLCLLSFVNGLDLSLINTSLPAIEDDLAVSTTQYSWIAASYTLAGICLLPLWRPISASFGRKWTIIAGGLLYIAGCLISALAQSTYQLIAGRAFQGIGGYCCFEVGSAILSDISTSSQKAFSQASLFGSMCIGASFSSMLGGLFSQYADWRCNFYFCLAVAIPASVTLLVFVPVSLPVERRRKRSILSVDFAGASLVASGTVLLLLGLQLGGLTYDWGSGNTIGLLTGGLACMVGFFVQQHFARQPILPYSIFRDLTRTASMIVAFCHGFAMVGALLYLPLYFHLVLGATYIQIGLWLSATVIPAGVVAFSAAATIKNTGHYRLIIFVGSATLCMGTGFFMTFSSRDRDWVRLIFFQLMVSVGVGALYPALHIVVQNGARFDQIRSFTAALEFVRGLGSVFGAIIGQVILQNEIERRSFELRRANLPNDRMDSLSTDWSAFSDTTRLTPEKQVLLKKVFTNSVKEDWILFTAIAGVGVVAGFFVRSESKRPRVARQTGGETHEMKQSTSQKNSDVVVTSASSE